MDKAIELKKDLSGLRVGRASASMLDQINVNVWKFIAIKNQYNKCS